MIWLIFALGCALLDGVSTIVEKRVLKRKHSLDFSILFAMINFVLCIPLLFFVDFSFPLQYISFAYIAAIFGSIAFWAFAHAMRHMDISIASPMSGINPAVVAVLAFFLLGETLKTLQYLGILLVVVGIFYLESRNHDSLKALWNRMRKLKLLKYIALSAIMYGLANIMDKINLGYIEPPTYMFLVHLFLAINFTVFLLWKYKEPIKIMTMGANEWKLILLASFLTVANRFLYMAAVSLTMVVLVGPIKKLSTVVSTWIGGEVFHEKGLKRRLFATFIILAGSYLVIFGT